MNLQPASATIVNEAQLPEPVHKKTDPRPGRAYHLCKGLLTDPLCSANTSKIPSDAAASIHTGDATNLPLNNLSDIADIFGNSTVRRKSALKEMSGGAAPPLEVAVRSSIESGGQK